MQLRKGISLRFKANLQGQFARPIFKVYLLYGGEIEKKNVCVCVEKARYIVVAVFVDSMEYLFRYMGFSHFVIFSSLS